MTNVQLSNPVQRITISEDYVGGRLDNFLCGRLKNIPTSRVYRSIRSGEVRVNSKRAKASYRLMLGDVIRIPPLKMAAEAPKPTPSAQLLTLLKSSILYEDDVVLVLNKPAGLAVHGGSGIASGLIEAVKSLYPKQSVELVHRLDRDTSGCLVLAKKRSMLKILHESLRQREIQKTYVCLLHGPWQHRKQVSVREPLQRVTKASGESWVQVSKLGKPAHTEFHILKKEMAWVLARAKLHTGRTHQIRVHAKWLGCPIIGDDKYGIRMNNAQFDAKGLSKLCLHAESIVLTHPKTQKVISVQAPWPVHWSQLIGEEWYEHAGK